MSLDYTSYVATLSALTLIPSDNPRFQTVLPNCIDYAEQRIYRELDVLTADVTDSSSTTTPGSRNFTLPTSKGTYQIVSEINVITPAGSQAESGTRVALTPVSRSVLDWTWPSSAGAGVPTQFCYYSQANLSGFTGQTNILLGPWPDDSYTVEVVGKIIPTPLSATNTTTFLSLYLPDLFLMASQIYFDNAAKNFGAATDDPRSALTHEAQYQTLLKSAMDWEARKRFSGASWTAKQLEPTAQPQRG